MDNVESTPRPAANAGQSVRAASEVSAELTFTVPQDTKPYFESSALTGGEPKVHFQTELRSVRVADMRPIHDQLEMEEPVEVVDLRHPIDFATDPYLIPGARRVEPEELEQRHAEIPRDRDIVLYCT